MPRSRTAWLSALASLLLIGGLVAWSLLPSPNDLRRAADADRLAGRWRSAVARYQALVDRGDRHPDLLLRLAEVRVLRGEWRAAALLLEDAARQPLFEAQADRLHLLRGWIALQVGDGAAAATDWDALSPASRGRAEPLRAELDLRAGAVLSATARLTPTGSLPPAWRAYADLRLAELLLPSAPSETLRLIDGLNLPALPQALPPFDPGRAYPRIAALRAAATYEPAARRIALARLLAEDGFNQAALATLEAIDPAGAYDSLARNDIARLQWAAGDPSAALATLAAAVERYPNVPALRRTQATIAVAAGDLALAREALRSAAQSDGLSAENYVTSAAIAVADGDFNAAGAAYDLAIAATPLTGTYHLQAANFYIVTPLRVCQAGRDHAQQAIGSAADAEARRLEAQLALRCDDPSAVISATAPLLRAQPADPQLLYLRGTALWRMGLGFAGRADLARAADFAPGSLWMRQAEQIIGAP